MLPTCLPYIRARFIHFDTGYQDKRIRPEQRKKMNGQRDPSVAAGHASADPPVLMCRKHVVERVPVRGGRSTHDQPHTNDPRPTTAAQMSARPVGGGVKAGGPLVFFWVGPHPAPIAHVSAMARAPRA